MHSICVVLPTRDRPQPALRALESVIPQLLTEDEILVVDNASTPDAATLLSDSLRQRYPSVRLVVERTPGLSHARNRALREATADVVAFIDDDEVADPQWLSALHTAWAEAGPRVAAIGGPMRPDWQAPRPPWLADHLLYVISVLDLGPERKRLDQRPGTGYLWGGNMSFRRDVALELGGFHPDYTYLHGSADPKLGKWLRLSTARSGEEQELQDRLADTGWEIWYEPSAAIDHLIPAERVSERFFFDFYRQQAALAVARGRTRFPVRALIRELARYLVHGMRRDPRATTAKFGLAYAWTITTLTIVQLGHQFSDLLS